MGTFFCYPRWKAAVNCGGRWMDGLLLAGARCKVGWTAAEDWRLQQYVEQQPKLTPSFSFICYSFKRAGRQKMFKISPQREAAPENPRIFIFPKDRTVPLLLFSWRKRQEQCRFSLRLTGERIDWSGFEGCTGCLSGDSKFCWQHQIYTLARAHTSWTARQGLNAGFLPQPTFPFRIKALSYWNKTLQTLWVKKNAGEKKKKKLFSPKVFIESFCEN